MRRRPGTLDTAHASEPQLGQAETVASGHAPPGAARVVAAAEFEVVDRSHYEIDAELARGGMGRILHAVDRRHGRMVAIKELLTDTASLRARFRREALITARLQHPAIVPVYEAGEWPSGEPFYAMKMVEGRSLDEVIADRRTLEHRMGLLPNVIAVSEAIAYAHERGVIHRDLKPANVLVGDFGETVVIDWGLAKDLSQADLPADGSPLDADVAPSATSATGIVTLEDVPQGVPGHGLTVAGFAMGTPAYMAPEQARGETADERADVYALGGILYHLLTGRVPYADSKIDGGALVLRKVLDQPPTPVVELEPRAPPDLVAVVAKAMARVPDERYPTAKQLVDDLRRFETGQLVSVRDYSSAELFRRWLRRHRLVLGFAAVLIAVVAVGGTLAITRVLRERNRATQALAAAELERARAEEQSRIAANERATAVGDRERAEESERKAVESGNQAKASAQALVEGWVQLRFAATIGDCYQRGRGKDDAARHASLLLEVNDKRGIDKVTAVHPFGTSADACIVAASDAWRFPPGTRPGAYSLSLMADADGVRIGFAASDAASIRRVMSRDYKARLQICYRKLLRRSPKAGGKVAVALTAGSDGKTTVSMLEAFDPALEACLRDGLERWVFSPPRDEEGAPTTVTVEDSTTLQPPARAVEVVAVKAPAASAETSGDLDKTIIRRYIRQSLPKITYCYEKELLDKPGLAGTVTAHFRIGPSGLVEQCSADGLDDEVASCVADVIKAIAFPKPTGEGGVDVHYPFNFRATGG
jgi:serine/threonine protein kinase